MANGTRERMIAATARLLQHRGYHGTSLSEILAESGAPRGSLYFHFPGGKDEIAVVATRTAINETTRYLHRTLAEAKSPAKAVRTFFEEAAEVMSESGYTFGCPVAPMILDASGGVTELEEMCREAFDEWTGLFRQAFVEAGIPKKRAEALSLLVEAAIEGLLLIARSYRDVSPILTVAKEMEATIKAAMPETARPRKRAPGQSATDHS